MKLVAGLGNPGKKFERNRHNAGRAVVLRVSDGKLGGTGGGWSSRSGAEIFRLEEVVLAVAGKGVYMNESGEWVKNVRDFYKIENRDVIIVYDDLDLESGRVLVSDKGPKIHNGVNSVATMIGTGFLHLRCGVDDRNGDRSVSGEEYVLGDFTDEVKREKLIEKGQEELKKIISTYVT